MSRATKGSRLQRERRLLEERVVEAIHGLNFVALSESQAQSGSPVSGRGVLDGILSYSEYTCRKFVASLPLMR